MYVVLGLADILEEIDELVATGHQQFYFVIVSDGGSHLLQVVHNDRVACYLCPDITNGKDE